jgi:hypothetical protein
MDMGTIRHWIALGAGPALVRALSLAGLSLMAACGSPPEQVTFYTGYGYRDNDVWRVPLRAWVHEDRALWRALDALPQKLGITEQRELGNFRSRARAFVADSQSRERVTLRFDEDPDQRDYTFTSEGEAARRTDLNGLIDGSLTLPIAKADDLLLRQRSQNGWLTFRASSRGHEGTGRLQLIPPTGLSVVSDIDDTIKDTLIPAGSEEVLRNTFFRDFVPAEGMATMYRSFGDAAFHYVSGGPFQLYGPIAEFLFSERTGFPAGTFHMKVIPKHVFADGTWEAVARLVLNPDATFDHKVAEISQLMRRFPQRQFILVGDSGERDPDVYRQIKDTFGAQVREIRIRDIVDDRTRNAARLAGMTVIPAPTITSASHLAR